MSWTVPVIPQRNPRLCWEACGRMAWAWRHINSPEVWSDYTRQAGVFPQMTSRITQEQMDVYYRQLGMRSFGSSSGASLQQALKVSPVVVTSTRKARGHAMVVIGYDMGNYSVIDPSRVYVVDYGEADGLEIPQRASPLPLSEPDVNSTLGPFIWHW